METTQPFRRLDVVPGRLFFSSLPSGHLEFSCHIPVAEMAEDLPGDAVLTWQLNGDPTSGYSIGGRCALTADDARRGHLYLATSLPPGWPESRLQVTLQMGAFSAHGEWPVLSLTQPATFRLPLDGQVLVLGSHRIGEAHRLAWSIPSQHFAWDFIPLGDDGLRLLNGPLSATPQAQDFAGFGAAVRAPAAGRVVRVADGTADWEDVGEDPTNPQDYLADLWRALGNYVILDHGDGVWALLAHLKCGSVCVQQQQEVAAGTLLGALGNSGSSSGPHLHLHFMDGPDALNASPLPITLTAEGSTFAPQAGQILGS